MKNARRCLIICIITILLFFTGCSQFDGSAASETVVISDLDSSPVFSNSPSRTMVVKPSALSEDTTVEKTELGFSVSDFFEKINPEDGLGSRSSFNYQQYTANWAENKYGTIRYIVFTDSKKNSVFAVSVVCDQFSNDTITEYFINAMDDILNLCSPNFKIEDLINELNIKSIDSGESAKYEKGGSLFTYGKTYDGYYNGAYLTISAPGSDIGTSTLPLKITKNKDIFSNTEIRESIKELNNSYNYEDMLKTVSNYINKYSPSESDSAYALQKMLPSLIKYTKKCNVHRDEVSKEYSVTYNGVDAISKNVNIVPLISESTESITVGFKADDWIFFDNVDIYLDDAEPLYLSFGSVNKEVLNSAAITEYADILLNDDDIEKIAKSKSSVIRFSNSDTEKTLDHKMSKDECMALKVIHAIKNSNAKISSMIFAFEND